jgi:hypothetical protein
VFIGVNLSSTMAGSGQKKLSTPFPAVRPQHRPQGAVYYQKRNTLIDPLPEPPHTATARLQWPLQPHWKAPVPSSCNGSAGLGLRRLEFVRCGLLTEVWSAPPKPLPERRTNAKFAGRTRPERHEDVATHQGYDCAPSCRRRRPSYGLQFDIGQMVYYHGADSIRCRQRYGRRTAPR